MTDVRKDVEELREALDGIGGCTDGACMVVKPKGMHTNGGCKCLTSKLTATRVVRAYMDFVKAATATLSAAEQRAEAAEREVARLTGCLKTANEQTEHFERQWYLTKDRAEAAEDALRFVERWANHHGQKPSVTPAEALSAIQHYPPIKAITRGYADGNAPDTPDPFARAEAAEALLREIDDALRAAWGAGSLPADVISGDLARRCRAHLSKEASRT